MKIESKNSSSYVVSVNPYKKNYVVADVNRLEENTTLTYEKQQYVISMLCSKYFISAQIVLSVNINDDDLEDALYTKAYDELALDQAVEYKIKYIEIYNHTDEENRHFHIFIVNPTDIKENFSDVEKKLHYIDVLLPIPLLFKSLYTNSVLDEKKTDIFVYLQENDAFITFYKNGEFLYNKSIGNFSYKKMHERFCELYGESISYRDFIEFLTLKKLKDSKSKYKKHIFTLYKELFSNLNEIITFVKRAYEIEKIDHLYIDSAINTPTKLYELAEVDLEIRSSSFNFHYGFQQQRGFIEAMHPLMHLYTKIDKDERYDTNFTLYPRPPKLSKRPSGKLLILIIVALIVGFAYPVVYWLFSSTQKVQKENLESEYSKIHSQKIQREDKVEKLNKEKKKATNLLKNEKKEYLGKKSTLMKIHEVKVNYPMKAKIIASFTEDLNLYDVKLKAISYDEQESSKVFNLYLVADNDKDITDLVRRMSKEYRGTYSFYLDKIYLEPSSQKYFTELQVTIV